MKSKYGKVDKKGLIMIIAQKGTKLNFVKGIDANKEKAEAIEQRLKELKGCSLVVKSFAKGSNIECICKHKTGSPKAVVAVVAIVDGQGKEKACFNCSDGCLRKYFNAKLKGSNSGGFKVEW